MFQPSPKSAFNLIFKSNAFTRFNWRSCEQWYYVIEGWSNPRAWTILDARGRSPMCDRVVSPLLGRGAGGRSPGYL
jgi:hypothetical protein